jgi:hypothetical protein
MDSRIFINPFMHIQGTSGLRSEEGFEEEEAKQ